MLDSLYILCNILAVVIRRVTVTSVTAPGSCMSRRGANIIAKRSAQRGGAAPVSGFMFRRTSELM